MVQRSRRPWSDGHEQYFSEKSQVNWEAGTQGLPRVGPCHLDQRVKQSLLGSGFRMVMGPLPTPC